jgi:hypothetical protein
MRRAYAIAGGYALHEFAAIRAADERGQTRIWAKKELKLLLLLSASIRVNPRLARGSVARSNNTSVRGP